MSKSVSTSPRRRAARRRLGDRRGAAALEFAAIASLLFSLLLGAMDLSHYWYTMEALREYTAETMRAAVVAVARDGGPGFNYCGVNAYQPVVVTNARTPGLDPSKLNVSQVGCKRTTPSGNTAVVESRTVRVVISYSYAFSIAHIFGLTDQAVTDTQETTF